MISGRMYLSLTFKVYDCYMVKGKKVNIFRMRHFMVLAHVISVIMMEYKIEYREIRYLVSRSWHKAVCAV
jgi:hypothetical protein